METAVSFEHSGHKAIALHNCCRPTKNLALLAEDIQITATSAALSVSLWLKERGFTNTRLYRIT
jgi:hypothetical protein